MATCYSHIELILSCILTYIFTDFWNGESRCKIRYECWNMYLHILCLQMFVYFYGAQINVCIELYSISKRDIPNRYYLVANYKLIENVELVSRNPLLFSFPGSNLCTFSLNTRMRFAYYICIEFISWFPWNFANFKFCLLARDFPYAMMHVGFSIAASVVCYTGCIIDTESYTWSYTGHRAFGINFQH